MNKVYKMNKKYSIIFKKWLKDNGYTPSGVHIRTNKRIYANVIDPISNKRHICIERRPYGEIVDKFYQWMIETNQIKRNQIPLWFESSDKKSATRSVTNYKKYIQSSEWKHKSRNKIQSIKECECCGDDKDLHCHHYNYLTLGNERDQDLFVLCKSCHEWYHIEHQSNRLPKDKTNGRGIRLLHIVKAISKSKRK